MKTVPASAASTLLAERPDLRSALRDAGRMLGRRAELDLDAARSLIGEEAGDVLEAYSSRCEMLWERLETPGVNGQGSVGWVAVRRPVASWQQVTSKKGRADLVDVYEALSELPGLAVLIEHATSAEPVQADLAEIVSSLGGRVVSFEDGSVTLEACLEGQYAYPDLLGGLPWPGEVRRLFTINTRQAAWRDRRVRRLAQVHISADELWADPTCFADEVAALPALSAA